LIGKKVTLDRHFTALFLAKIRHADADLDRAIFELWNVHSELLQAAPLRATGF
jgi:hypothetical protein